MTREEAISVLHGIRADNLNLDDAYTKDKYEALGMAIKALEQEPVLDKIRAEIEDLDRFYDNDYFSGNRDSMFKCNEVMEILDKYKVETEADNGNVDN